MHSRFVLFFQTEITLAVRYIVQRLKPFLKLRKIQPSFFQTANLKLRILSLFLLTSLLVNSTPAAPSMIIASSLELGQNLRYAYLTSPTLAYLSEIDLTNNFIFAFFFNGRKKQTIAKIEISPKKAVIREGEELQLTATALDSKSNPIQGLAFKWTAVRINAVKTPPPNERPVIPAPINLQNGTFAPQYSGVFEITAQGGGVTEKILVRVLPDTRLLAAKEATEIQKNNGKLKANKRIREDVQKELALIKPFVQNNSTKLNKAQTAELNSREKEYLQANPVKKELDPNKKYPPIKKAPRAVPVDPNQIGKIKQPVDEETVLQSDLREGGPSPVEEGNGNNSNLFYPPLSGYLNTITGSNITGCGYDGYGWTGAAIDLYLDGNVYTGTYLGSAVSTSGCSFSMAIPGTYQDGQHHNVYAYIYDYDTYSYFELDNSPQTFQIGGGGGGAGTNSNFNNNNYLTADDPGVQPGSPANDGTVGAGSSNFSFSAPVLSLPGRGMDIDLSLTYNSLLWHNDGTNINYDIDKGFPGPGWNIGFGKMMDMGSTGGAMLEDTSGTRHSYDGATQSFYGGYSTYYGKTNDGSFIDYQASRSPSGLYSATAQLANGTVITYGAASSGVLYPTSIKDRHGNYLTIAYQNNQGPRITTITDDLNRNITFNYDSSNRLVSITGPGFNGSTRIYVQLHYTQQTLSYGFTGLTPQVRDSAPWQLDAIYYPVTNTGYWFGDPNSYSSYGMIAKVSERRGMSCNSCTVNSQGTITAGTMTREMTYNYLLTPNPNLTGAPQYTKLTEDWFGRDTSSAAPETLYSIVNNPTTGNPRTTTITLPNGNKVIQYSNNFPDTWYDGLLYQVEMRSPNDQVLSKTVTNYSQGDYNSVRVIDISQTDEKQQTTKQTFSYNSNGYNQVETVNDLGYTNNLLRKSVKTYETGAGYLGNHTTIGGQNVWSSGRHIFSLVKTEELFDAAIPTPVRLSRNEYNYDESPLIDTPGVLMYDQAYNPNVTPPTIYGPNCVQWDQQWNGWDYDDVCLEYEQIPNYDTTTLARGNVTSTKTYSDAAALSGGIVYDSTYDITGNVRTTTTDCCQQMAFGYSTQTQYSQPDWHRKGSINDQTTQITEGATYDPTSGLMMTSTDFNNVQTQYYYDAVNRPIQVISATQAKTETQYDDINLKVTQTAWKYNGPNNYEIINQSKSFANGQGQVYRTESLLGTNTTVSDVQYDNLGRKTQTSMPHDISLSANQIQWTTYHYDLLSRMDIVTAPDNSTSKTIYNEPLTLNGNLITGNTVRSQDAWGRERLARTDAFGRLIEVYEPDSSGTGSVLISQTALDPNPDRVTSYVYDPKDELTEVHQGNQVRAFRYDSLGRLTHQKLAEQTGTLNDTGVLNPNANNGWSDVFFYDTRSNLVQRIDARGVKTNFVYNNDPLNRLQSINYDKTTAVNDPNKPIADAGTVTLGYETLPNRDKTRVVSVKTGNPQSPTTVETNDFDNLGRLIFYNVSMFGKSTMTTGYEYDSANRLTQVTYPDAIGTPLLPKIIAPTYDNASRLKEMSVNGQLQLSEIVYNPMSQVTQLKTGAATNYADIEQYNYDNQTGLLTNQKVYKSNNLNDPILNLSYDYQRDNSNGSLNGKTGQLTKITNHMDPNKNRKYEFDTLGRLHLAKGGYQNGEGYNTTVIHANWGQTYSYDRYGNRTNVQSGGNVVDPNTGDPTPVPTDGLGAISYDQSSNRIINTNYEYDLAGNQTRGQAPNGTFQRFEYDAAGRLVTVKDDSGSPIEIYAYGASRQRLRTTVPNGQTTYYVWGGSSVLCEYTETTNNSLNFKFSKSYIYAGSRLLSTQIWNGSTETTEFHHPDRLGTKLVTNDTTNTFYEQSTLPFGTSLNAEFIGTPTTNQRFTSYDRSQTTGIDYAVNRSYSSGQGRFTSVDPMGFGASNVGNPQSNNLYAYTENNPIDFVDPSGLLKFMGPPEQPQEVDWGALLDLLLGFNYPTRGPNVGGTFVSGGGLHEAGHQEPQITKKSPLEDAIDKCAKKINGVTLTSYERSSSVTGYGKAKFNTIEGRTVTSIYPNGSTTQVSSFAVTQFVNIFSTQDLTDPATYAAGKVNVGQAHNDGRYGLYSYSDNTIGTGKAFTAHSNVNYRAKDAQNGSWVGNYTEFDRIQVHELGNSLATITGGSRQMASSSDIDAGDGFEDCVKTVLQTGRLPLDIP